MAVIAKLARIKSLSQPASYVITERDRTQPVQVQVDRERRRVSATLKGVTRTAAFYGDQGCVIHPEGQDKVFFTPTAVKSALPDGASQPWPMGDAPAPGPGAPPKP